MISEDEWEMLREKGHTDDEIMEMNEQRKDADRVKLQALHAFMETDIFKQLPKESQQVVEQDYNRLEQIMYCVCQDDPYADCYICLQVHRRNRYGFDVHNTDCMCNDCTGMSRMREW